MERGSRKERREIQAQHGSAKRNVRKMKSEKLAYNYRDVIDQNWFRVQTHFQKYRTVHFRYAFFYRVLFTPSAHFFPVWPWVRVTSATRVGRQSGPGSFTPVPNATLPTVHSSATAPQITFSAQRHSTNSASKRKWRQFRRLKTVTTKQVTITHLTLLIHWDLATIPVIHGILFEDIF